MAGILAACFALIPGMPFLPFMLLGLVSGGLAYLSWQQEKRALRAAYVPPPPPPPPVNPLDEPVINALAIDDLRLELGFSLLPLINDARGYRLTDQIDRKSTRLNSITNAHLVCRLLLAKKNTTKTRSTNQNHTQHN